MAIKKYKIDCSGIRSIEDLAALLNQLNLTYTRDTSVNDATFERFERLGIIGDEIEGKSVCCNVCRHTFKSVVQYDEVECPNCGHKSYVEPE